MQYLLGNLPRKYLTELRSLKGLQAYPSSTKDHDPIDFSTGSVGLGAVAPAFSARWSRATPSCTSATSPPSASSRSWATPSWTRATSGKPSVEDHVQGLGNVLWIVDLNRQSLDRVIPGIRAAQLKSLFAGERLAGARVQVRPPARRRPSQRPDGEALRQRIDEMSNEEYQSLIRCTGDEARGR